MARADQVFIMKTYKNLYSKVYNLVNLYFSFKKARKGKTKKSYVIEFQKDLWKNLLKLQEELKTQSYNPKPLKTFILLDPKTRKISKSAFRDRIIHHALIKIIEPIFDKTFIYDSCANRIGKGNLFALKRFDKFKRKVSRNGEINGWFNNNQIKGFCLKADIKHYFQEVNHEVLIKIIKKKIMDNKVLWLIEKILNNLPDRQITESNKRGFKKGLPLGNLTSQFFANLYLNELDYFAKHKLKAKYYIRYVDDFVILNSSKEELELWKQGINKFLKETLKLELHNQKSKIIQLSKGIDFVGFKNFYYYRLLRKRNIKNMIFKVKEYKNGKISHEKILESFNGWNAYAKWANCYKLRKDVVKRIYAP